MANKQKELDKNDYKIKSWTEIFKDDVDIRRIKIDPSWKHILTFPEVSLINDFLTKTIKKKTIFPYPGLLFYAFRLTPMNKVKVVILGQDPYYNCEIYDNKIIPQAMGLSFSVPTGIEVPTSLRNIYKNLTINSHISSQPRSGNLMSWASQGVLLLNCALTVEKKEPNSHSDIWRSFTDKIIDYISRTNNNLIFLLWGKNSVDKANLIKGDHTILKCSHPSGYSYDKMLGRNPAFAESDHFGMVNKILRENNKKEIDWNIA